ncbi:hypothetical protein N781_08420 [Pontibacillus halophilus JSM 076056 = DSM 19796]|uniref:peptidylprolyl isomerase n=1 Tax=Pontibacillus halophilus JSM 076056 = DSM 19796 TaxID=1385510 RepID=A0A0A5GDQ4_9BACI|nr:peptidyl-prolyl cis-trans isomerase [Pontibacillus halophilus]KGX90109.1 hypothetical protein N781_08420 [Pontibacillus halophilus JSM 076056 = DSM 19796]
MTKRILWGIILALILINISTLVLWMNKGRAISSDLDSSISPIASAEFNESVALVGSEIITNQDWMIQLEKKHGEKVLKDMIDRAVVDELSSHDDVPINDKVLERELSLMETAVGITSKDELKRKRKEWEQELIYQIRLEELLTEDIPIEDQAIEAHYDEYKDQYQFSSTYQLSRIVVPTEEEADQIYNELEGGSSFSVLAREHSDDETRQTGGYLGYYTTDDTIIPKAYLDEAARVKEEDYTKPFQTDEGYVLLYVHRSLPEIALSYEDVKGKIRRELASQHLEGNASTEPLWQEVGVDWIYNKGQ